MGSGKWSNNAPKREIAATTRIKATPLDADVLRVQGYEVREHGGIDRNPDGSLHAQPKVERTKRKSSVVARRKRERATRRAMR